MDARLPERVGLQQRVLPAYRAAFFDTLGRKLPSGLSVLAGAPEPQEGILQVDSLRTARWIRARNIPLGAGRFRLVWQRGWREWLSAEDPQVVVLEANPRVLSNYGILDWMRSRGRPLIAWSLGPVDSTGLSAGFTRLFHQSFSAVIVYSRHGAEVFHRIGIPSGKVFVAPNAVESKTAEELLGRPDARAQSRKALGLDDRPVILFVGRLQPRKRVDLLLQACGKLESGCQLLITGDGPDRERLEEISARVFPTARFLGDLRGEALGRCFLASDLFVMPGTGGLALQEALLYGKPVAVAEADGSQADLVRPGENGWLLVPGEESSLLAVLREALTGRERLEAMGRASRRIVRETATMEKMVDGFMQALAYSTAGALHPT